MDAGLGLVPSYECLGLDDSSSVFQPTFMQQRLKWPPEEFQTPIGGGSFEGADSLGLPDNDPRVPKSALSPKAKIGRTYNRQDSSNTESSVCLFENSLEQGSETGETETGIPYHHLAQTWSLPTTSEITGGLRDVCLYADGVMSSVDDAFFSPIHDVKLNVNWMEEGQDRLVKEEFPALGPASGQFPGVDGSWVNRCNGYTSVCPSSPLTAEAFPTQLINIDSEIRTVRKLPSITCLSIPSRKLTPEKNLIRKAKVARYLEKRKRRTWGHRIRYASRKAYAENRPRIKGRFAKQEEVDALKKLESARAAN